MIFSTIPLFLIFLFHIVVTSPSHQEPYKALRFSEDSSSFIQFTPDFTPFQQAISVCCWVKENSSPTYPTILFVSGGELTMLADGNHIGLFNRHMHLDSKISVIRGRWYHQCATWEYSTRSHKFYNNGVLIGSQTTPAGRRFTTSATLTIGNWGGNVGRHELAGDLYDLNFYATELSGEDVRRMYNIGLCQPGAGRHHEQDRLIRWEDIQRKSRSGSVIDTDVDITISGECVSLLRLANITRQLDETQAALNETQAALSETNEVLSETQAALIETQAALIETQQALNETQEFLVETQEALEQNEIHLNQSLEELSRYNQSHNKWDWGLFKAPQYLNQTISLEQSQNIRDSWDEVANKIIGFRITPELVRFWQAVDCEAENSRPWSMLQSDEFMGKVLTRDLVRKLSGAWDRLSDKLVGVRMTEPVIELLSYVTNATNCYCGN